MCLRQYGMLVILHTGMEDVCQEQSEKKKKDLDFCDEKELENTALTTSK